MQSVRVRANHTLNQQCHFSLPTPNSQLPTKHMKTPLPIANCLATIVILSTIATTAVFPTIAQTNPQANPIKPKTSPKIRWKPPIPPSSLGIPGNRAQGGGTRGCKPYQGIAALVPSSPQKIAWGQTIANRPTVWLNIPQGLAKDLSIEIAVREQNGKPVAKQLLTTKNQIAAGAIGVAFPPATVLQLDRTYRWEVAVYCDNAENIDSPLVVQGQIQRIATPPQFSTAKVPLEMAQILAEQGIWYDAISQLGNRLAKTKEPNLTTAWLELLKSAGIKRSELIRNWHLIDSIDTVETSLIDL
jgi:Domain of Unknown Function (DUF928)